MKFKPTRRSAWPRHTAALLTALTLLQSGCGGSAPDTAAAAQTQELQQLRESNQELQRLRAENQELPRLRRDNQELERLRPHAEEVAKLRQENAQLRAQLEELRPSKRR